MKLIKSFLFCSFFFLCSYAEAALPPYYHTKREIEAILDHPQTYESLGSAEPILEIKKIDEGYQITTLRKILKVELIYLPSELIGSNKFELKFSPVIEKP